MSEFHDHGPPMDDDNRDERDASPPPEATAGGESRNAEAQMGEEDWRDEGETNGRPAVTPAAGSGDPRRTRREEEWREQGEPRLRGPEIPNAEVSEGGVFTVRTGDTEVYETAEVEFGMGCGLDEAKPIEWLWSEHIPLGSVTILEGVTETGKSLIAADLAGRLTRGAPWPGQGPGPNLPGPNLPGQNLPGKVLYVCGDLEDWDQMVMPRLLQAGAEMIRVGHFDRINTHHACVESRSQANTRRRLHLPEDLGHLEFHIRVHADMRLVVIDSLAGLCPNARAREDTLRQLHEIAARRNVAIVIASCPARQRSRNKLVPTVDRRWEAVRCVFNTLRDLEDDRLFYLAPARMTFAEKPQWLPYRIGPTGVVWEAPCAAPPEASGISEAMRDKRALRDDAIFWLREELKEGPQSQKRIVRESREYGFSYSTLRRAKEELGLRSIRTGFEQGISYWAWALPENAPEGTETPAPVSDVSTNGKTAEKTAARPKPRKSDGKAVPSSAELKDYLDGLGPDLDAATLARLVGPALISRIVGGKRDTGDGQPVRRSRGKRRRGRNGRNERHATNGHHESNGNGRG